jgi:hypothetical protein
MADEKNDFFKGVYVLCHTEEEIIVFTIKMNIETGTTFNIFYSINKAEKGLSYNSIVAFACYDEDLYIAYRHEAAVGLVKIKHSDREVEKIVFSGNPLDIHDAKFSTISKNIFMIVKGQGLYNYDILTKILVKKTHPYLIQFDKVTKNEGNYEYIGVYVDQTQKDLKEVLIEFVNFVDNTGFPWFNKAFTTNGLKFKSNLTAFGGSYHQDGQIR